jgi:hypothetical protein
LQTEHRQFWLSLCKIVRSSVILLLPLWTLFKYRFIQDSDLFRVRFKQASLYFILKATH